MMGGISLRSVGCLVVACSLLACQSAQESEQPVGREPEAMFTSGGAAKLFLSGGPKSVQVNLDGAPSSRMADLHLTWTGGWTLKGSEPGTAAVAAEKEVRIAPEGANGVRVTVFSASNLNKIGAGELVSLQLEGGSGGQVDIVPQPPMLAPAEAEEGLKLGEPLPL